MPKRNLVPLCLVLLTLALPDALHGQVSGSLSVRSVKAGGDVTITGSIRPGRELHIAIASTRTFSPASAIGSMEKRRLAKAGRPFGFEPDTTIPYLHYIITSHPKCYGGVEAKSFGGAFFFKGLYSTQVFRLAAWSRIPPEVRPLLGPIKTAEQWNLLRYARESTFGINTIVKESTCKGKVVLFSRCVVADHETERYYWNEGTRVLLDKKTGEFSATFRTFSHTSPGTEFEVYVNGKETGSYLVEARGFWLPVGWRYANPLLIIIGAIVAGTFYSAMGASGGLLMAAFQIMLVGTAGPLGINSANVLKPSNLPLMFTAPSAALYRYWIRERRLALPAAMALAAGVLLGSFVIGPPLSTRY